MHDAAPLRFICIGGALVDRIYTLAGSVIPGSSNPASLRTTFGGVARNVAETLARLGADVSLVAAIGEDPAGDALTAGLVAAGVCTDLLVRPPGLATAEHAAIIDGRTGALHLAAAAMDDAERALSARIEAIIAQLPHGAWVFADANLTAGALAALACAATEGRFRLAVDGVSVAKCLRLPHLLDGIAILFLNTDEAAACLGQPGDAGTQVSRLLGRGAAAAVVTCGAGGLAAGVAGAEPFTLPAAPAEVADVTGAGDSLVAATLWRLGHGDPMGEALRWGLAAAALTVGGPGAVHPHMAAGFLAAAVSRMPRS